jgi:hypothetical protein
MDKMYPLAKFNPLCLLLIIHKGGCGCVIWAAGKRSRFYFQEFL